jgi:DNA-binding MarR family transcriptional regulator
VAIHSQGRPAMRTLSNNLQVSMPTMTGIVERLVKAGYARRVQLAEDRRQVLVELSAKGKNIISEFQQAASFRWQTVLKALDHKEIESFSSIVMKLRENIKKASHETV